MLSALYALMYGVGFVLGFFSGPEGFGSFYLQHPAVLYLGGRLIIAFFGAAAVPLVYKVGRRLFNTWTGLMAATLLAISPVAIAYSNRIRPDSQMTFLVLAVFWFCLDILQQQTLRSYILAGL